jgi:hypothetical protein
MSMADQSREPFLVLLGEGLARVLVVAGVARVLVQHRAPPLDVRVGTSVRLVGVVVVVAVMVMGFLRVMGIRSSRFFNGLSTGSSGRHCLMMVVMMVFVTVCVYMVMMVIRRRIGYFSSVTQVRLMAMGVLVMSMRFRGVTRVVGVITVLLVPLLVVRSERDVTQSVFVENYVSTQMIDFLAKCVEGGVQFSQVGGGLDSRGIAEHYIGTGGRLQLTRNTLKTSLQLFDSIGITDDQ